MLLDGGSSEKSRRLMSLDYGQDEAGVRWGSQFKEKSTTQRATSKAVLYFEKLNDYLLVQSLAWLPRRSEA